MPGVCGAVTLMKVSDTQAALEKCRASAGADWEPMKLTNNKMEASKMAKVTSCCFASGYESGNVIQ